MSIPISSSLLLVSNKKQISGCFLLKTSFTSSRVDGDKPSTFSIAHLRLPFFSILPTTDLNFTLLACALRYFFLLLLALLYSPTLLYFPSFTSIFIIYTTLSYLI